MIFEWKVPIFPVKAQDAGEYLEGLEKRDGKIEPKVIVDEAENPDALLHNCFEWDNYIAGPKYRESQAHHIIRNIIVVRVDSESCVPIPVRAYVYTKNEERQSICVSVNKAMANNVMRINLLEIAKEELESFRKKYANLKELETLFIAIDEFLHKK